MVDVGRRWRAASTRSDVPLPDEVASWWKAIIDSAEVELRSLADGRSETVVESCLELLAAADEASAGVGVLDPERTPDDFDQRAMELLAEDRLDSSLCVEIDASRAFVLPKMHTPQTGLSIRSLSHHLACTTVLADDPGASVLSLTSAGMAQLSRVPGKEPSRVVALWKDGRGGTPREVSLERGAEGVVLCLTREMIKEWSADGRSDEEAAGHLLLSGVHQVFPPK